jgi:hypothetical protein
MHEDDEPSLGSNEPLEPEGTMTERLGRPVQITEGDRNAVYDQSRCFGFGNDQDLEYEHDGREPENERDRAERIAKHRARIAQQEPTPQIDSGSDGRLVAVQRKPNGRLCDVRPLTPEEYARFFGKGGPS